MAAVDPSESPTRQKCLAEDVETCSERSEAAERGRSLKQKDEPTRSESTESRDDERRVGAGQDGGGVASHSEVSDESGAGADETTCNSLEDQKTAGKMAEVAGSKQRAFDWSENEDGEEQEEEEAHSHKEENDKSDPSNVTERADMVQQDAHVDGTVAADPKEVPEEENPQRSTEMLPEEQRSTEKVPEEQNSQKSTKKEVPVVQNSERSPEKEVPVVQSSERSTEKEVPEEPLGDADGTEEVVEDEEEPDRGEDPDLAAKQKKCRLVCKECGMRFSRRETFNLHRHFHAHADELTPLTCKECGLTFQHRSSLIKHKTEHKEKEEELVTPKKEVQTKEEGSVQCAECRRIFTTVNKLRDHSCSNTAEKPYHCPLCRQDFQFRMSITKHMKTHSRESMFTCQECNKTFPNSADLRYHQRCHTALKPYECPECGLVFKHYSVMEDHRRKHTDSASSHLCTICGKTFKYSSLLHQHQYLHTGQKPFRCPECGKTFAFAQNMKAHCRQHRLRETNSPIEQPCKPMPVPVQEEVKGVGKENSHQSEETKRTFRCPLCPEGYSSPANLRAHMLIHEAEYETLDRIPKPPKDINKHWEKGHTCPHCPCVYRDESSLKIHLLSVHKLVAYFKKVPTPYKKKLNLQSGDNVRVKWRGDGIVVETHKCPECGKAFRHRSVLELHMRIHTKDKPYQCKVCGKSFRFSSYLQQHVIIHTGQKPYKCPDCGKDFAFLQNMRTHQKLHQEKPFRCTNCRKGYSDETQLQQHMLSHNGDKPHKCHQCDKSFGLAYLLRDHMNTHTGERPHRCDECHKTFSWFSSLLVHQKIHTRKHQGFSQYNSLAISARMRGRGNRGRRGGRSMLGWSRPLGGSGMLNFQPTQIPVSALSGPELHRGAGQPQSSMVTSHFDLQSRQMKEPRMSELQSQPVQWKVDGGEVMPVPLSQQQHTAPRLAQIDLPLQAGLQQRITQPGPAPAQSLESSHVKESTASFVSSHLASVPKKSSPLAVSAIEQHRQPIPITWSMAPMSTVVASTSSLQRDFSIPSYIDGAALWSIRPSANSQSIPTKLGQELIWRATQQISSTLPKKEDNRVLDMSNLQLIPSTVSQPGKPWASGLAGASAQKDQSSVVPISTPVSLAVGSTLWDIKTTPGIPKTINSTENLVNQDCQLPQKQVSSGWTNLQSQTATQQLPISIQYDPHRFGQGIGTSVWGFKSNAVGPQTLITRQLKPGNGPELQQQPIVTGTQIIINQPSPFFTQSLAPLPLAMPGPHPLHTIALPRPQHPNIFFTSQPIMSERPHIPQSLPLPQVTPRTEPHKRLLQCMICGCSLPREQDLQMHYLQHAQGEI
ncbi:uncharacterized protein zgc:66448 [Platichthys flesus]|uniref:uncharacterized protein zgc:66448 n=1 Tax=Platichthys flesus TaxID=8260 RepID=UPI001A7F6953|nr:uncharacterized protein zgc:66448 [Platichthys flesus]